MKSETTRKFVGAFLLGILLFFILIAYLFTTINNQTDAKTLKKFEDGTAVREYTNPLGDRTVKYEAKGKPERLFVYSPDGLGESISRIDYNPQTGLLVFEIQKGTGANAEVTQKKYRVKPDTQEVMLLGGQPVDSDDPAKPQSLRNDAINLPTKAKATNSSASRLDPPPRPPSPNPIQTSAPDIDNE